MGRVREGEGVSMVKGVEGVLPKSLPGVQKLLHNINTHRYCIPKTQIINKYKTKQTNGKKKYQKEKKNLHECTFYQSDLVLYT
jgi:hypothetical protein